MIINIPTSNKKQVYFRPNILNMEFKIVLIRTTSAEGKNWFCNGKKKKKKSLFVQRKHTQRCLNCTTSSKKIFSYHRKAIESSLTDANKKVL